MNDPKIDPERMKKWEANILPVPSAELLKGDGSGAAPCSGGLTNEQIVRFYNHVNDPKNGWINLGSRGQNAKVSHGDSRCDH